MAVPLQPVLLVLGLLLASIGVFVYRVAVLVFGSLLGGAGGMLVGVAVGAELLPFVALAGAGALLGVLLIRSAFEMAILVAGACTGLAAGAYVAGASLSNAASLLDPLLLVGLAAGAVAGWLLEEVIVVGVSAAWGASLVAVVLAPPIQNPGDVRELVDAVASPALLAVFVGGIGVQIGLLAAERVYGDADTWFERGGSEGRGN